MHVMHVGRSIPDSRLWLGAPISRPEPPVSAIQTSCGGWRDTGSVRYVHLPAPCVQCVRCVRPVCPGSAAVTRDRDGLSQSLPGVPSAVARKRHRPARRHCLPPVSDAARDTRDAAIPARSGRAERPILTRSPRDVEPDIEHSRAPTEKWDAICLRHVIDAAGIEVNAVSL